MIAADFTSDVPRETYAPYAIIIAMPTPVA